jgi:hypothetical protein
MIGSTAVALPDCAAAAVTVARLCRGGRRREQGQHPRERAGGEHRDGAVTTHRCSSSRAGGQLSVLRLSESKS